MADCRDMNLVSLVVLCMFGMALGSVDIRPLSALHGDIRLNGYYIGTLVTNNHHICVWYCYTFSLCKSISFSTRDSICQVHSVSVEMAIDFGMFTAVDGYIVSDIETWPKELAGSCGDRPCPTNSRCEGTPTSYVCRVIDCGSTIVNGVLDGPSPDTTLGAAAEYTCHAGFEPGYPSLVCLTSGQWISGGCNLSGVPAASNSG